MSWASTLQQYSQRQAASMSKTTENDVEDEFFRTIQSIEEQERKQDPSLAVIPRFYFKVYISWWVDGWINRIESLMNQRVLIIVYPLDRYNDIDKDIIYVSYRMDRTIRWYNSLDSLSLLLILEIRRKQ